ncbi:MAG: hypothetical protein HKN45_08840 [Flavobacteriales bacterium]|nr:hypothetical protein [Flavobacteriales bacterium]
MADKYANPISTRLLLVAVFSLAFFYWASRWSHVDHDHHHGHDMEMNSDTDNAEEEHSHDHDHEGDHGHEH